MKRRFAYYDPCRTYERAAISWPWGNDILEITHVGDGNIGFIADAASRFEVVNPVLYVCRNKGVIRMNRTTCAEVRIPDRLIAGVRRCSSIEFTLSYPETSFEMHRANVEHLLRFPDFLIRPMPPKAPTDADMDMDELECPLRKDEESMISNVSPRVAFEEWIRTHGGEIVFESTDGYVLAHDGHNLLLVSFFDGSGSIWLADEEMFNGDPPMWFSESAHVESPLYKLRLAAEHFNRLECCKVLPLTIVSDRIEIVNEEDMMEEWCRMGIRVCYCHRQDEYLNAFEDFLASMAKDGGEFRVPGKDNMNALIEEIMRYEKGT
ncbi:MAG: hypothetical protein IKQ16_01115 [Lentisphaeria bacterium]|nr:hypothetical protein [Lentisphaeria bacterium]